MSKPRAVGDPSHWCTFLPDILPTLMVPATLLIAVAIIAETALSFLGLGQTALALLGQHAERGAAFPHQRTLEGYLAGTCNFSRGASRGDGLRDALDPGSGERS